MGLGSALVAGGCGPAEAPSKAPGSGGKPGVGGAPPAGGAPSAGGGTALGGAPPVGGGPPAGGGPPGNAGGSTAVSCSGQLAVDPNTFPACPDSICTGGRCVPKADYAEAVPVLSECDPNTVCAPDPIVATKGDLKLAKCNSVVNNEGRCMSLCVTVARALSAVLPQDVCAPNERCAPCYNPSDGSPTGACGSLGCDDPPSQAPILFAKCCGGRGDCVPKKDLPPGPAANNTSQIDCPESTDACIPSVLIKDPTYKFPACTACVSVINGTPCVPGGPGVCLPDCVVNANPLGSHIGAGTGCGPAEKCAPCKDPAGKDTGACNTTP